MKKRLRGTFLVLALTAGLTGCQGREAEVPATAEAVQTTAETAAETAATTGTPAESETEEEGPDEEEQEGLYCWVAAIDGNEYCLRLNDESDVWIRPGQGSEIDEDIKEKDWLFVECGGEKTEGDRKVYTEVSLVRHIYKDEIEANWNSKKKGYIDEIAEDRVLVDIDGFEYTFILSDDTEVEAGLAKGDYIRVGLPYEYEIPDDFVVKETEWVMKAELPEEKQLVGLVEKINERTYLIMRYDGSEAWVFLNSRTEKDPDIKEGDKILVTYGIDADSNGTFSCSMVYSVKTATEEELGENWPVSVCGVIKSIDRNKIVFDVQTFEMTIILSENTAVEEELGEGDYIRAYFPYFKTYPENYILENALSIKKETAPQAVETTALVQFINDEGYAYLLREDGSCIWVRTEPDHKMTGNLQKNTVIHLICGGLNEGVCWGIRSLETVSPEDWNTGFTGKLINIIENEYVIETDGKQVFAMTDEDTVIEEGLEPGDMVYIATSFKEMPQDGAFWSIREIKEVQ